MCGREEMGTTSPFQTLPSPSPVYTRHRVLPAVAENSTDLANFVEDTTLTANCDVDSLPGTNASLPEPSTPESFPRFSSRTSTASPAE